MVNKRLAPLVVFLLLAAGFLPACLKKKGEAKDAPSAPGPLEDGATELTIAGSVSPAPAASPGAERIAVVSRSEAGELIGTTLTATPTACRVPFASQAFSSACPGFAGNSFAFALRQTGGSLVGVEMLGAAVITGDIGTLALRIGVDTEAGLARATVDTEATTTPIAAGELTPVPDLSGRWQLACEGASPVAAERGGCDEAANARYLGRRTFFQQAHGGKLHLGSWRDEERRRSCMKNGGTEAAPFFNAFLDGVTVPLEISSRESFVRSADGLLAKLDAGLRERIIAASQGRTPESERCARPGTIVTAACKVLAAEPVIYPDRGVRLPRRFSRSELAAALEVTKWKSIERPCWIDRPPPPKEGEVRLPRCPPQVVATAPVSPPILVDGRAPAKPVATPNAGMFTAWVTDDAETRVVELHCLADDGGDQTEVLVLPVLAAGKNEALAALADFAVLPECAMVADGPLAGLRTGVADAARRGVFELFNASVTSCASVGIPKGFTFASCEAGDASGIPVCGEREGLKNLMLTLAADGRAEGAVDVLDGAASARWLQGAPFLCPNLWTSKGFATAATDCRQELLGLDAAAQLLRFAKLAARFRPLSEQLLCFDDAESPFRKQVESGAAVSCMPEIRYERDCDADGVCRTLLRCPGSFLPDGSCYSGSLFAGRIAGRDELLQIVPQFNGGFSLARVRTHDWNRIVPGTTSVVEACTDSRSTLIGAYLEPLQDGGPRARFNGVLMASEVSRCEGQGPVSIVLPVIATKN